MFGERGVGKTSLAITLAEILTAAGVTPLTSGTINCDGTDDFSKLWHKVFRELQVVVRTETIGFGPQEERSIDLDTLLPDRVTPDDVRVAIKQAVSIAATDRQMIIIFDEVDRITRKNVTTQLADTIKNLSDHLVPVTIILVGVADAVEQLISEHLSIERSLVQVRMPRMSIPELEEVIDNGLNSVKMEIKKDAKRQITALSHGLPHFTHLLALESAHAALEESRKVIHLSDVISSTKSAVEACQSLLNKFRKATRSQQRNSLYEHVFLACALTKKDELGWFSATSVSEPMSQLRGKTCSLPYYSRHLNEFTRKERGEVLEKKGSHRLYRYRFSNPLLEPFAIIKAISTGAVPMAFQNLFATSSISSEQPSEQSSDAAPD